MPSYRKNIRGDGNEANEEFSHNRVQVTFNGAGPVLLTLFLIAVMTAAIAWLFIHFATLLLFLLLATSLVLLLVVVIVALCFALREISKTYFQWKYDRLQSRVLRNGEVMSYLNGNAWDHLSAEHVRAGIAPVTMKELPSGDPRWDAVLDLRKEGRSMHQIADDLKVPYNRVRTFLNQVEKNTGDV